MKSLYIVIAIIFSFKSFGQIPSNDLCVNAQAIVLVNGQACINSTNLNATSDNQTSAAGTCDVGTPGNEVWYTFVATEANNVITITPNGATPASDLVVTLVTTGCGSGVYSQCNSATGSNSVSVTDGLVPGQQVLFSVESNGTDGTFQVCISSTPPPATPGEGCGSATNVCSKSSINFPSMSGFTASGVSPSCFSSAVKKDVWVKFTVGVSGTLEFVATPIGNAAEFDWAVYDITSGCLGTEVACDYDFSGATTSFGLTSSVSADNDLDDLQPPVNVTAGRTYAILIDNFTTGSTTGFGLEWGGTFQMGTSALFTVTPQSSCSVPVTVNITNQSVGATTYTWNYGDGVTSNLATPPAHTYTNSGDYLVSLVVNGGGCTSVYSQRVNLNAGPVITISPLSPTICVGSSVNVSAQVSLGTPYNDYSFSKNPNVPIPGNSATGITNTITSSGMISTTIGTGMLQSICFTINHGDHTEIKANGVTVTVNGITYTYTPLPLPAASGYGTYCFPQSVLNAIMAAGGSSNTNWVIKVADTQGGLFGDSGDLVSWEVVLRDQNGLISNVWSPTTAMTNSNSLTPIVSPTTTTVYTLTSSDKFGCVNQKTFTVNVVPSLSVSVTSGSICSGSTINLTATGASSYTWSPSVGLSAINGSLVIANPSVTTVYSVTALNSNGCSGSKTTTVTVIQTPTITATSGFICGGGSTTLTASGGTSYTWAPATGLSTTSGSVVTANPGSTTEYTVTGLNSGCSGTVTTTVSVGGNPTVSVTSGSVCAGSSLTLTASGATNYTWSPAAGLSSTTGSVVVANPTTTTVYSVLGASGTCTNTSSGTVTVVPSPTLSATNGSVCGGSSATLTVSGATDYTWSPASDLSATNGSVVTASPSVTTVYTITGSAFGCSSVTTSTVSVLSNPTVSVNGATVCAGSTVNISASGATNYTWSASPSLSQTTGSLVTCIPSSTETFTVIGANGSCTNSAVGTVTVINLPVLSSSSSSICFGNTGSLSVSGATTYTWLPSASLSPATGVSVSANPSVTTVYTITGTIAGCSNTTTATMSVVPLPTVSITNASVCASNPSVTLSASGATNYSWTPAISLSSSVGVSVVSNATTTTNYTVSGETAGCTNTAVVSVSVIPNPTLSISNATICSGTNATLTASGASSYTWSPNVSLSSTSGSVVVASPGSSQTYSIVGESLGCTGTTTLSVDVIPSPTLTVNSASICSGESATLTATGAANYTWSPSTNLSSNSGSVVVASSPTTETFTLSGSNGICVSTVTTQVQVTITPTVSLLGQDVCSGASSATLTASGAQNYTWSPSTSLSSASGSIVVANPSATTEYSVVGANGICTNTAVVTVSVLPTPTLSVVGNTICSGSSGTLSVSGASNYTWSPAASLSSTSGSLVTANPIITTTYNVVGSLGSCLSSTTVAMVVNQTPTLSAVSQSICSGQSVQLQVTGASNYTWSPSSSLSATTGSVVSANPLVTESYTVVGETAGCSGSVMPTVSVTTTPTISVTSGSICSGQSVQLTASGATNYTWSPSGSLSASTMSVVQASPNTSTTYSIVGANGVCTNSATTSVVVTPTPTLNLNSGSICIGNSFTLTASGATGYTWSPGTNLSSTSGSEVAANPNTSTDYTVVGANGTCTVQSVTTLTVKPNIQLNASPDQTICAGQSTLIYANGGITYTWSPGITIIKNKDSIVTVMPPLTTIYTVTANKPGYCAQTTTISVLVNPLPIIDAGRDTTINIDETTLINGTGDVTVGFMYPNNYDLNCNFCSSITVNPQENTCFVLTGVNDYGCRSYDTVCVYVTKDWNVYIPNTFTPNGDTKNDVFYVQGYGMKEIKLRVFNRWGQQIFESDSTNPGWDGKFNGVACEQGVYVYSVEAVSMGGQNYRKVGHVNLISNLK